MDKTYERSCKEDLNQTVPMADGTELSCEKFLERRASRGILLNLGNKE